MKRLPLLAFVAALLGTAACSAGRTATTGPGGGDGGGSGATTSASSGGGGSGGSGGSGGISLTVGVGAGGAAPVDDCDAELKGSVYILGWDKQFARFEPPTSTITVLGSLECPGEEGAFSAFSMAVDRHGTAWVLYASGKLYTVDIETLVCTPTDFEPCQSGFCKFGMGFSLDAPGSEEETLYVSGWPPEIGSPGLGLGKLDTETLALTPIGNYDGVLANQVAEMTGTGDARLFGYFPNNPRRIAEIDKATAHILQYDTLNDNPPGGSWAFARWGGAFYTMNGPRLSKFDPVTKVITIVNSNVGFDMVGAGVSTCAPAEEPK